MKYKISLDGQSSEQTELYISFELCGPCITAQEDKWTDVRPQSLGILPLGPSQKRGTINWLLKQLLS